MVAFQLTDSDAQRFQVRWRREEPASPSLTPPTHSLSLDRLTAASREMLEKLEKETQQLGFRSFCARGTDPVSLLIYLSVIIFTI